MNFKQIIADIKKKVYYSVYLLVGEESYYIDEISNFIEKNVLTDIEKEFNQTILYGKDTDVITIVNNAKRFPMMANYQVVIVKEAQNIKDIFDNKNLIHYIKNPLESTILVLCYKYKKYDKRKVFAKAMSASKKGITFESKKLYENQIPTWISNFLKQKEYSISPKAVVLLSEYLGTDLGKIANEISKLIINVPKNSEITPEHIEENIGISKDFNYFELQNALGKKDIFKANQIVNYFASNPKEHPLVVTISILYIYFSKTLIYHCLNDKSRNNVASVLSINPYFVKDFQTAYRNYNAKEIITVISYIREYDMKSKGVNNISTSGGELLKELIFKILH
jgi:DNA polymerase-3 subunit delta